MHVWEGLCYFDRNSTTIIYIFLLNEKMNLRILNILINHKHKIYTKQEDLNITYLIIKSQSHLGFLCCIYEEIKTWTGLLAVKNKFF